MTLVPTAGPDTEAALAATDLGSALKALSKREVSAPAPKAPRIVQVKPEAREALDHLADDIAALELPSERRQLTLGEQKELLLVKTELALAKKTLDDTNAKIRTAVFNHLDAEAFEDGVAADYSKDGHLLTDGEIVVGDTGQKFTREITNPQPYVTAEGIHALYSEGKISQEVYLKATAKPLIPRPVLNEEGLLEALKADPNLAEVLQEILVQDAPQAKFWVRPVK